MQKQVTQNSHTATTQYMGGYQYSNTRLQFFPTAEGYVKNTIIQGQNSYDYIYNLTDHLGNIRMSFGLDPKTQQLVKFEENNYYPFGLKHSRYNDQLREITEKQSYNIHLEDIITEKRSAQKTLAIPSNPDAEDIVLENSGYQYRFGGKEYQDELGLNTYDFGFRGYMPDIVRWGVIDSKAEAYYPVTPYQYVLNNPLVNADVMGQWTITRHYNMTYNSVSAAGVGKEQADLLAHYASVYADNPGGYIALNNTFHPSDQNYYRRGTIDYSGTKNSQTTDWNGKGYNYNIWHSMRSGWEKDNDKISSHDATERGMEFGWDKIFESAKSGKLSDLKENSSGIQAWGQGVHALQDAYAHKGTTIDEHSAYNDRYGDTSGAQRITNSAATVHNIMSGNWKAFEGKTEIKFDAQGMSKKQFEQVMSKINEFLKK